MNKKEYVKWARGLVGEHTFKHKGCLVTKQSDGYYWGSSRFESIEKVEEAIDKAKEYLSKSINNK